jgi:hypothetical protein
MKSAKKMLAGLGLFLGLTLIAQPALAASVLGVPLPSVPVLGGGGGPGGGGPGGGGPGGGPGGGSGGGGSGMPPGTTPVGVPLNLQGAVQPMTSTSFNTNHGPDDHFGDPLSTNIFGSDTVKAHLRYYGESGSVGSTQAVGINFTFAQ